MGCFFIFISMEASQPIGVFDSGVGGLTVAHALANLLPNESFIYYGDTAHLPYGEKSAEAIISYSIRIADFLLANGCKAIVIACNSASSTALEAVIEHVGDRAMVFNVIEPIVANIVDKHADEKVGVIGTKATIGSGMYEKKIKALKPNAHVASMATPLFAPMIEEGFYGTPVSIETIKQYLKRPALDNIECLVLACTHYPLLHEDIENYYKGSVTIIDTPEIVAEHIKAELEKAGKLNPSGSGKLQFYVSDYTASFEKTAQYFFEAEIKLEELNLWK